MKVEYWLLLSLALGAGCSDGLYAAAPNIVMIVADDHAPWAVGAAGHPQARTPNLDGLFRDGVWLKNCFVVTPVCSASRAALMTSRYPTETGITDYLSPARMPDLGLAPNFPVWPRLLSEAGYQTALVGKWHLGETDRFHPTRYGYHEFSGFRHGGMTSQNPLVEIDGIERRVEGWTPDILTELALGFISRARDGGPFCLSLHFWAPHANAHTIDNDRTWLPLSEADFGPFRGMDPLIPNPDFPRLDVARVQRMTREYLASIASVDRNVGRLLEALDEWQLASNTVVIYTSDHGYNLGHHGIWHKGNGLRILKDDRGFRPNMWDNSLRTPTMIRWPQRINPGSVLERCVTFLDWFPTILAMAGVDLPPGITVRGRNFLPLLDRPDAEWDDDVFVQYRMWDWNQTAADLRAFRTPHWKLIRDFHNNGQDEVYDLMSDPAEMHNLIESKNPRVLDAIDELDRQLRLAMESIDDRAE